jgi:hypothetical protein
MASARSRRIKISMLVGVAGFLGILLSAKLAPHGPPGALPTPGHILAVTAIVAVGVAWWMIFAVRIFRDMDEFAQTGERVSWYWGGLVGLMASVPVYAFIGLGGLHWLNPATDVGPVAARAFTTGYMLPVAMQVAGAVAVAIWWRVAKR